MTTKTPNGKEILVVGMPEKCSCFQISDIVGTQDLCWYEGQPFIVNMRSCSLPIGQWSILGRAKDISEEQARGLVESDRYWDGSPEEHGLGAVTYYRDYPNELEESFLFTALESFQSWLKAEGINGNDLLIIKNS